MDILIVSLAALAASALTLFSGFGLGTLLMPVVAIFFPIEMAIAITAIVHLANNLFKVALLGKHAVRSVLISFGVPAIIFALLGALALNWIADMPSLIAYTLLGRPMQVFPAKLLIGLLILSFVMLEFSKKFAAITLDRKYLPAGGAISGFFGGFSGHQGAFRSMFLLKAGLDKNQFVATGVLLAVMVDMSRMLVYGWEMSADRQAINWVLVLAATLSAFAGAFMGTRLLNKLTIRSIQLMVSVLLIFVAVGLITGFL